MSLFATRRAGGTPEGMVRPLPTAQGAIADHFRDTGDMTTTEAWKRVGDAVRNQRLHLGWTQQDASEHAGVSLATWRLIESAGRDRYQDLTMRGVCRAFGWPI